MCECLIGMRYGVWGFCVCDVCWTSGDGFWRAMCRAAGVVGLTLRGFEGGVCCEWGDSLGWMCCVYVCMRVGCLSVYVFLSSPLIFFFFLSSVCLCV